MHRLRQLVVVKAVLYSLRQFRRIGFEGLSALVTPSFRYELTGLYVVKPMVSNLSSVGRSKDYRDLLAALNKQPTPNHLPLTEGMENLSVPEYDHA